MKDFEYVVILIAKIICILNLITEVPQNPWLAMVAYIKQFPSSILIINYA